MPDGPLVLGITARVIPVSGSERRESLRITADARRHYPFPETIYSNRLPKIDGRHTILKMT